MIDDYVHLSKDQLRKALVSVHRRSNNVDTRYGGVVPTGSGSVLAAPYQKKKQKLKDEATVIRGHLAKFEENPKDPF